MRRKNVNTVPGLDTGAMIRKVQREKRYTHASLGRIMGRDQSTVSQAIRNNTVQTHVLWDFSLALRHNFFADLAQQFRTACPEADTTHPDELAALRTTVEQLRTERDYLRKAIDMLGVKTG